MTRYREMIGDLVAVHHLRAGLNLGLAVAAQAGLKTVPARRRYDSHYPALAG